MLMDGTANKTLEIEYIGGGTSSHIHKENDQSNYLLSNNGHHEAETEVREGGKQSTLQWWHTG